MTEYSILRQNWERAADYRSLSQDLPEVFRYETENNKEHYQELQVLLRDVFEHVKDLDPAVEKDLGPISWYLLGLAMTIPEIDEEVYDHKRNLVNQYQVILRRVLPLFCEDGSIRDEQVRSRIRSSIAAACACGAILREKYERLL